MPYAFKQFVQELETSGIHINLTTNQGKTLSLMPNEWKTLLNSILIF